MEKLSAKTNSLNWFEIPVSDFNRAKKFYETVFDINMDAQNMMGMDMGFFPADMGSGKVSGAIVKGPMHQPSAQGVLIYLNGNPDLAVALGKIEKEGGKVAMPKTQITEDIGYMAFFSDTEGNTIGLHSMK